MKGNKSPIFGCFFTQLTNLYSYLVTIFRHRVCFGTWNFLTVNPHRAPQIPFMILSLLCSATTLLWLVTGVRVWLQPTKNPEKFMEKTGFLSSIWWVILSHRTSNRFKSISKNNCWCGWNGWKQHVVLAWVQRPNISSLLILKGFDYGPLVK